MRAVGLKTLKDKLSEYVRLAAAGETILISDREKIVAELVPPSSTRGEGVSDAVLADLSATVCRRRLWVWRSRPCEGGPGRPALWISGGAGPSAL
ncbi:MAG: prevent-host-death protein [Actinomycetota bacterium]|nr:prevent-host-death protein [Actinomycetota bacterium]